MDARHRRIDRPRIVIDVGRQKMVHWNAAVQFIIVLLSYTGVIYGCGELSSRRLGLHATGRVLQALTLRCYPLLPFAQLVCGQISLGSCRDDASDRWSSFSAAVLAWIATTRTIDHWLRERQTTFIVCYLILCLAGGRYQQRTTSLVQ